MVRDVAVQRIKDGLGFRTGTGLDATIILRLQEAQRELELGKTLPTFLLQEDQPLSLLSGEHVVALPTGFLRGHDEGTIRYTSADSNIPIFLTRRYYPDAVLAQMSEVEEATAPEVYVIRKSNIDFIVNADQDYDLEWNYYKAGELLVSNVENEWLEHSPEWLIGEAGYRIAQDMRNASAVELFADMRKVARAARFGEQIAAEESDGPFQMGADS